MRSALTTEFTIRRRYASDAYSYKVTINRDYIPRDRAVKLSRQNEVTTRLVLLFHVLVEWPQIYRNPYYQVEYGNLDQSDISQKESFQALFHNYYYFILPILSAVNAQNWKLSPVNS